MEKNVIKPWFLSKAVRILHHFFFVVLVTPLTLFTGHLCHRWRKLGFNLEEWGDDGIRWTVNRICYNVGPPRKLCWFITSITMVYDSYYTIVFMGVVNQQTSLGAPHCTQLVNDSCPNVFFSSENREDHANLTIYVMMKYGQYTIYGNWWRVYGKNILDMW